VVYFLVTAEDAGHAETSSEPGTDLYVFDTWLGDELVQAYPGLLATAALTRSLEALPEPTGFHSTPVIAKPSSFLGRVQPRLHLPVFRALHVYGKAGVHPLGLTEDRSLVVSQAALERLVQHVVLHLQFSQFAVRREPPPATQGPGRGKDDVAGRGLSDQALV
jgi:hypothetical protein